jgi:hypothetical protein
MQLRAVGRRCSTGSATVLGDLAQGTTPWAASSWAESLAHLGHEDAHIEVLDRGFRVPGVIIDYAARLIPCIAPGLAAPTSVRDDRGSLTLIAVEDAAGLESAVLDAVRAELACEGSIGVIAADAQIDGLARLLAMAEVPALRLDTVEREASGTEAGLLEDDETDGGKTDAPPRVALVPASVAKGLEYDGVVVVEPAAIAEAEPDDRIGLRRLYVVLTRAVSRLTVVRNRPAPDPLGDPRPARTSVVA